MDSSPSQTLQALSLPQAHPWVFWQTGLLVWTSWMAQGSPHLLRTLPSLLLLWTQQQGDGHAHFCQMTTALGLPPGTR